MTQYGFSTVIGALGPLEKSVETAYRTDTAFTDRNMRSLPDAITTKDAGGVVRAKSQVFYDDAGYGISGVYGLPTRTRSWHDVANDLYIETKAKYDAYGNVIESADGRGNVTQTEYSAAYSYAYPTKVTTPVPDSSGVNGSNTALTTQTAYDLTTGLPTSTTDANGQVTTISYADPVPGVLDPLLRAKFPATIPPEK
ncbi:MAG: hypothetical protein AB7F88_00825 [Pyrinomonadaceae bacterium]